MALLNAMGHRDQRKPGDLQTHVFSHRVEIINPGGLTLERLGTRSIPSYLYFLRNFLNHYANGRGHAGAEPTIQDTFRQPDPHSKRKYPSSSMA